MTWFHDNELNFHSNVSFIEWDIKKKIIWSRFAEFFFAS